MNLFGVPIFISITMIEEFLTLQFPLVTLNQNELLYVFLAINFIYLWFMCRVIAPFLYKTMMFVVNHVL